MHAREHIDFPVKTPSFSELSPSLKTIVDDILAQGKPVKRPLILHTLGIPGAGKSSFIQALVHELNDISYTVVAFDRIMVAIPEYQEAAKRSSEQAFQEHELPARAAGYLVIKELIERRANILFDHSGANSSHPQLLSFARANGYRVLLVHITAPVDSVKERLLSRQQGEGRFTPLDYVEDRKALINDLLPTYRKVAASYAEIRNEDNGEEERGMSLSAAAREMKKLLQPPA